MFLPVYPGVGATPSAVPYLFGLLAWRKDPARPSGSHRLEGPDHLMDREYAEIERTVVPENTKLLDSYGGVTAALKLAIQCNRWPKIIPSRS